VALAGRAAKLLERHGAAGARVLSAMNAGEATGTLVLTTEYADTESYGAAADGMVGDAELQQLVEEARGPGSPVTIATQHLMSQVDLDRSGSADRGSYVEVHVSRLMPGRMEAVLEATRRAADYVEARGATNAQLWTMFVAGTASNQLAFTFELPSLRAWGALTDSWTTDPEGLALYTAFLGPDPSDVEIFSGLYVVVPT
jgi:hypothetical protein